MSSSTTDRRLGLTGGTAFKAPVKAATTANVTLSGEQSIDGVSCVTDDRILVKNQTTASQNGIYVVDTGSWTRDLDFDGRNDVVQGTQVYVNTGGTANGGGTFVVTTSGTITPGSTSIAFSRTAAGTVTPTNNASSASQTLFTVATYQPGANSIEVYVNGLRQRLTSDYTETSSTSITFTYALQSGDEVDTFSTVPAATLTAAAASTVSVADAGDYFVGTTAEAVLQEIAQAIAADNGDASVTLTNASSDRIQRWNTALTSNRTVTLSTSNAKDGATFVVVRSSGATGNFTLTVGSTLATLRATGEWCRVVYDAGTSAWVLSQYGILPTAEIRAMSADNGDAGVTLTVASSERTQRWATVLTADRTCSLSVTGAYSGARFHIVRTEVATGSFSLVVSGTAVLLVLASGQWCDVEYTGTAWIVVGFGDLRPASTSVVSIFDDYLGEEIDGHRWQSLIGTDSSCRQAIVRADQISGIVRLTTGVDAGATMALNGTQLQSHLNWKSAQGGLAFEAKITMDAITSVAVFIGLTDQVSALEMPFTLAAGDALTSNATDACGILFDTAADTDNWWLVGVAADIDATKQNSAVAPTASTYETWRIELSATGVAGFYRNGTLVGTSMSGALSATAALTPIVAAFSRTSSSRNIDVDFVMTKAQR